MKIEHTVNGAVLNIEGEKICFKFEKGDLGGLRDLLYEVCEQLIPADSKYNRERIWIRLVHGRGFECKDKNCEICKETKEVI